MVSVQRADILIGRPLPRECVNRAIVPQITYPSAVRTAGVFPTRGPWPFLTWAGSKAPLLKQYQNLLPLAREYSSLVVGFLGGGSVFWHLYGTGALKGKRVILVEANRDIANAWIQLQKNDPDQIMRAYKQVAMEISQAVIEEAKREAAAGEDRGGLEMVRSHFRTTEIEYKQVVKRYNEKRRTEDPVTRAVLTIYLSKTARNGLYRVRKSDGGFNVPWGGRREGMAVLPLDQVVRINRALQGVELLHSDFEIIRQRGIFDPQGLYWFDPPYFTTDRSGFTGYTAFGFGPVDLYRLIAAMDEIGRKGGKCMMSNTCHPKVAELFLPLGLNRAVVYRRGVMAHGKRKQKVPVVVPEYLLRNYHTRGETVFLSEAGRIEALHALYLSFAGEGINAAAAFQKIAGSPFAERQERVEALYAALSEFAGRGISVAEALGGMTESLFLRGREVDKLGSLLAVFTRGLKAPKKAFNDLAVMHRHYDKAEAKAAESKRKARQKTAKKHRAGASEQPHLFA